jgi:hypothetical protein
MKPMARPTPAQVRASIENGKKSAGPRTPEGKAKVSMNALKHGLLAQRVVLPSEKEDEFQEFSLGLEEQLRPVGELEAMLVDSVAAYAWRLRRLVRVERGILLRYTSEQIIERAEQDTNEDLETTGVLREELQHCAGVGPRTDEAMAAVLNEIVALEESLRESARKRVEAKGDLNGPDGVLGRAFMTDALGLDAFAKLSRYESHIQRSMFKALDELQRLQAVRGQTTPSTLNQESNSLELEEGDGDGAL